MTKEEAIDFGNRVIDLGLDDVSSEFAKIAITAIQKEQTLSMQYAELQLNIRNAVTEIEEQAKFARDCGDGDLCMAYQISLDTLKKHLDIVMKEE